MSQAGVTTRKWTRAEYAHLVEAEILGPGDRVELLAGDLLLKEPQHRPHVTAIQLAVRALRAAFGPGWDVQVQAPIALGPDSEPEPDVSVVPGDPRDYGDEHPGRPVLVVEVALSGLDFDREHKGGLYARAGLADYWIVNLPDRRLEIYREPSADPSAPFGWRHASVTVLPAGGHASPLGAPAAPVAVADLLP
jgi:Uma2 family endonuclease